MGDTIHLQYVGFQSLATTREYTFRVMATAKEPEDREFTLSIAHEAFLRHQVRYQDGPDICSVRLHTEFADGDRPTKSRFRITETDIEIYRDAHAPKSARR